MASQLPINRIQSCALIAANTSDLVADTESVVMVGPALESGNILVMAVNQSDADGAILTSMRLESFSTLGDGTELAIDAAGVLVVKDSIVEATGLGVALTPAEADTIAAVVVKERIAGQGQVVTDETAVPVRLMGDAGKVGNQYLLEAERPEIGYESRRASGLSSPLFYRVVMEVTAADATFVVVTCKMCHDFTHPPVTREVVA